MLVDAKIYNYISWDVGVYWCILIYAQQCAKSVFAFYDTSTGMGMGEGVLLYTPNVKLAIVHFAVNKYTECI